MNAEELKEISDSIADLVLAMDEAIATNTRVVAAFDRAKKAMGLLASFAAHIDRIANPQRGH